MSRNKGCPACHTHCATHRSLRDDKRYDALITALYDDMDKYEEEELAFHEEDKARNQQGLKSVPSEVWESSDIVRVDLSRNSIEELPIELSSCVDLQALILSTNKIKVWPAVILKPMSNLSCLKLDNNPLKQANDEAVRHLVERVEQELQQKIEERVRSEVEEQQQMEREKRLQLEQKFDAILEYMKTNHQGLILSLTMAQLDAA